MKIHTLTFLSILAATALGADDHDHGHKCACEAEEFGFSIDCNNTAAMLESMQFLQSNGCAADCSEETAMDCAVNWLIVQSHHDYCPEDALPQVIC